MSLKKNERLKVKRKLLADLAAKKLNSTYEEPGPIWSIAGGCTMDPNYFNGMLSVPMRKGQYD
jgi:hypothetical protein